MEEPPESVSFAQCVFCGKPTFKHFLDEELRCEYCRELGRRRTRAPSSKEEKTEEN